MSARCSRPARGRDDAAGWAAIFVKAFALVAREQPVLRTLYAKWPRPGFYELPRSIAHGRDRTRSRTARTACCRSGSPAPDEHAAGRDRCRRSGSAKEAPIDEIPMFRKIMRATRLPLPLRRLSWAIGLNFGRQRAKLVRQFRGDLGGRLWRRRAPCASARARSSLSYGVVAPDQTIDVVIRWDHRVTDAALIAKALTRLEQVLNTEIAAEFRANRRQGGPKPVRAVGT